MSRIFAALLVTGSILASLLALAPVYTSWVPTLPEGLQFEVGDRASIEDAMRQVVEGSREQMRRALALPMHLLAAGFVVAAVVIARFMVRGAGRHGLALGDAEFWHLIATLDWQQAGDGESVCAPLVAALARKPVAAIEAFEELLSRRLHALDTEAHAREIGELAYTGAADAFSVDGFLYARCRAVANGQRLFEAVLADPKQMPKDKEFEALLEVAAAAYESKTGATWDFTPTVSYETFANVNGWPR